MTTGGSTKPPEDAAEPLAALLQGLYLRGLAVGPDDALRVTLVFRHSAGWDHARKVRALKAILARSEEERRILDDLSPFLFTGGERNEPKNPAEAPATVPKRPEWMIAQGLGALLEPPVETPASSGNGGRPLSWKTVAYLSLGIVLFGIVLFTLYEQQKKKIEAEQRLTQKVTQAQPTVSLEAPPETQGGVPGTEDRPDGAALQGAAEGATNPAPAGTATSQGVAPPAAAGPKAGGQGVNPAAPVPVVTPRREIALFWVLVCSAGGSAVFFFFLFLRQERQAHNLRSLTASNGPRTYRLERALPTESLDQSSLREAVSALSAPVIEREASWLDENRTVRETARGAGRLSLHYSRWREHRPVLFIEDVSPSMVRWPDFGLQIFQTLKAQGSDVTRCFMNGLPDQVSFESDLQRSEPLHQIVARLSNPILIVFSDASDLDDSPARHRDDWLGALRQAVWLHPCDAELWGRGARWLKERLLLASITDEQLPRLGRHQESHEAVHPWKAPRMAEKTDLTAYRLALRNALGDETFSWLQAGALLDSIGSLTARNWWALRNEGIISAPLRRMQRVWSLPGIAVGADGTIALPEDLRETLVENLRQQDPGLLARVVGWADEVVTQDLEALPQASLAAVAALSARTRLLLLDPKRRRNALRNARRMKADGYRGWLGPMPRELPGPTTAYGFQASFGRLLAPRNPARSRRSVRIPSSLEARLRDAAGPLLGNLLLVPETLRRVFSQMNELMLLTLGVLSLTCGLLAYTWASLQVVTIGYRIDELESRLTALTRTERQLQLEAAYLGSGSIPDLERRAVEELGMQPVTLGQVVFWEEISSVAEPSGPAASTAPAPPSSAASDPATPRPSF